MVKAAARREMTTSNQSTISFVFKLSGIVKIMTLLLFAQLLYKLFPDTSFPKQVILNSVVVFWEVSFACLTELIVGRQKLRETDAHLRLNLSIIRAGCCSRGNAMQSNKGLFTYYVSQKRGFVDPPSPLCQQMSAFG